jgi:RNA-directed DNA polymerase
VKTRPRIRLWMEATPAMGARRWDVPRIATLGALEEWLGLATGELEWFGDARGLERIDRPHRDEALRHYRYRWVPKRRGGMRLIEAPKPRTKVLQRKILHEIVDVLPLHDAAHGFRARRSIRTHASAHVGCAVVLRVDLEDFFLSISAARVAAIFRAAGYPMAVAWALTTLTTNVAPPSGMVFPPFTAHAEIAAVRRAEQRARTRHLPQGAPTSPALANLAAFGLDVRLDAVARAIGATYTRYADDLVFSGDAGLSARTARLVTLVATIARGEGFAVNHRKTRVMRRGVRQSVTGVVVNERLSVPRDAFDRLKATLHNCVRSGPASQNRAAHPDFRAHLAGRIAFVASVHAERGARLAEVFERIDWTR